MSVANLFACSVELQDYSGICSEGLTKTTINLNADNRRPCQDWKSVPPEYKSRVLPIRESSRLKRLMIGWKRILNWNGTFQQLMAV
jgi:hypothetical protein